MNSNPTLMVPNINHRQRIPQATINEVVKQIAEKFHPQRVILFGSYAYGTPRPESDLDLLVVMDTKLRETEQALRIRLELQVLFGLDVLVYTQTDLQQRLSWGDSFLKEITENGIVLYESTDSRMDQ